MARGGGRRQGTTCGRFIVIATTVLLVAVVADAILFPNLLGGGRGAAQGSAAQATLKFIASAQKKFSIGGDGEHWTGLGYR
jgi:hypothetical protein